VDIRYQINIGQHGSSITTIDVRHPMSGYPLSVAVAGFEKPGIQNLVSRSNHVPSVRDPCRSGR